MNASNTILTFFITQSLYKQVTLESNTERGSMKYLSIHVLLMIITTTFPHSSESCKSNGKLVGTTPPPGQFNPENDSVSCKLNKTYTTFNCSPSFSKKEGGFRATLTLNSFEEGGDGGAASECDGKFHSDDTPVVALSTGWYNSGSRCGHNVTIRAKNGRTVTAMVVDECDSMVGCDQDHDFQPPCQNNIVDGSKAVWKALGVPEKDWGELHIAWFDAPRVV